MNATAFGGPPQEVITAESLLYDAAERVGRIREGRLGLHIHLSRLMPQNREESKVRIAFRVFESMVDLYRGQMFLLTNSDIVLICKDARLADLDAIVYKLRALFSKDPLTYAETEDGEDPFATLYDLEADYDSFFQTCAQLAAEAKKRIAEQRTQPVIRALDAQRLSSVLERMAKIDIAGVVRRQPCIRISERNNAAVAFQEFYVSIGDLQKVLAPDVNLLANRWLFQHLSQDLDQLILAALETPRFRRTPVAFSVNLNLATVESPAFERFLAAVRSRAKVLVEFQLVDIFGNLDGFFRAQTRLRALGVSTVLDGMNAITLQFMDAELYETDFVKVTWSPDMATEEQSAELVNALGPVGFDRVILSRCDSEGAIAWGLKHGIRHFQGRFLDSMVAAVTMTQCPKAAACTLPQCIQRHGVIAGRPRAECGDNAMLDTFPPLKSFG